MNRTLLSWAAYVVALALPNTSNAQTLGCVGGGSGGPIPVAGSGGGGTFPTTLPPDPGVFQLNVAAIPPGASVVSEVKLLGITHTYVADLHVVLTSPAGLSHNVAVRHGGSCDMAGDYVFVPGCTSAPGNAWTCSGLLIPGLYSQFFGAWPDGAVGLVNEPMAAIPAATGVWTLTVYDWDQGDMGHLNSWELCFGAAPIPASSAPIGAPLPTDPQDGDTRFGPTIELMWFADGCATSYDIELDGVVVGSASSSSFDLASTPGAHVWRVRARNSAGVGPWSVTQTFTDLGEPPAPCSGSQLTTLFAKNNNVPPGGILYFDVNVLSPVGILVSELDTNTGAWVGDPIGLKVYLKVGTHVGFANNFSAWTLVSTGVGLSAGDDQPTLIDVADFQIPPGLHGVGLVITGGAHAHTSGNGANQFYSNADLSLSLGQSQLTPFISSPSSSRVWNGTLRYNCIPPPSVYCTAGTTTNGCTAAISVSAQPSATLSNACQIDVVDVEGQKQGLIFYGVDNTAFAPAPWGGGSTSFFCVKSPLQRVQAMNSGGAAGACDGAFTMDWNAFQAAHPSALGHPFSVGAKAYVQAWFRDPPAPRTTNLSSALELTVGP